MWPVRIPQLHSFGENGPKMCIPRGEPCSHTNGGVCVLRRESLGLELGRKHAVNDLFEGLLDRRFVPIGIAIVSVTE